MIRVGVIGSTGYAGQQLVWLLHNHSEVTISFLSSHSYAGKPYSSIFANHFRFLDDCCIDLKEAEERLEEIDVLFIALPHGKSFSLVEKCLNIGIKVIDLGADFRLKDVNIYEDWYKTEHKASNLLNSSVYGLPELNREHIKTADLIANPGCYPTASILALAPLLSHKLIEPSSIIIDAKSGISGAGRSESIPILYGECSESIKAYGIGCHRHVPEIEQLLSEILGDQITLSFTPHLTPMNRGILATCYSTLTKTISQKDLVQLYHDFYKDEFFVRITDLLPETRWVRGSNFCDIGITIDKRTNRVIVVSAIDNLIKGAAGQAIQNMNIIFGLEENLGLKLLAMAP